jgi:hypothetical protein
MKDTGAPYRIVGENGQRGRDYPSTSSAVMGLAAKLRADAQFEAAIPGLRIVSADGSRVSKLTLESGFAGTPIDPLAKRVLDML